MMGVVYTDLADNLAAIGQFDEAQHNYESGLIVSKEVVSHGPAREGPCKPGHIDVDTEFFYGLIQQFNCFWDFLTHDLHTPSEREQSWP